MEQKEQRRKKAARSRLSPSNGHRLSGSGALPPLAQPPFVGQQPMDAHSIVVVNEPPPQAQPTSRRRRRQMVKPPPQETPPKTKDSPSLPKQSLKEQELEQTITKLKEELDELSTELAATRELLRQARKREAKLGQELQEAEQKHKADMKTLAEHGRTAMLRVHGMLTDDGNELREKLREKELEVERLKMEINSNHIESEGSGTER